MKKRVLALALALALCLALAAPALAANTAALADIAYLGDRSKCCLPADMALAYAEALDRLNAEANQHIDDAYAPPYALLIDIAGDGYPLLLTLYSDHSLKEAHDVQLWECRNGACIAYDFISDRGDNSPMGGFYAYSLKQMHSGAGYLEFRDGWTEAGWSTRLYYTASHGQLSLAHRVKETLEMSGWVTYVDGVPYEGASPDALFQITNTVDLVSGASSLLQTGVSAAAAVSTALRTYAGSSESTAWDDIAYVGDIAACRMGAEMARAYASAIRSTNKPVVKAALFDAGSGLPLLWIAFGDSGSDYLFGAYGTTIYGFDGSLRPFDIQLEGMALLRAGENGVLAQLYHLDTTDSIAFRRLSGGQIAETAFATGSCSAAFGAELNGESLGVLSGGLPAFYQRVEPDLRVLLSADFGGDFSDTSGLKLTGKWNDGAAMAAALDTYAASAPAAAVGVTVGGRAVQWTDAVPFIDENSRTMVPLRAVGDALGLTVDWDGAKREAIFSDGTKTLCFPIGSSTARTDSGGTVKMDTAAVIVNDRTYAPVRYLAEFFGHTVDWDGATKTVIIQ